MKEENVKPIELMLESVPPPSPIGERECSCGCGVLFVPKRRDQIYVNRQHANYGYNHGRRKQRSKNQINAEKGLRLNDKLLDKYWRAQPENEVIVPLLNIKADGFDQYLTIGSHLIEGELFYKSFNYYFRTYELQGVTLVRIQSQKVNVYAKH